MTSQDEKERNIRWDGMVTCSMGTPNQLGQAGYELARECIGLVTAVDYGFDDGTATEAFSGCESCASAVIVWQFLASPRG